MLDRMSLSIKNQWFDEKNRAYIYFSIEDIMELLNCGRNKAIKSMRELDDETGIGLIEKRRQGFGKVNVIYVKTFMSEKTDSCSSLSKCFWRRCLSFLRRESSQSFVFYDKRSSLC